ncbi:DUF4389 domain-containing protein [Kordiimonas sp. SCSIO 12610]|uniref:DUF4389 domain-containing protein n=1 Tax=Kordiimonas sp. SCSIO 12610 TaxID=2829597 RepID=UPI00210B51FC|nr:DUF4389 domain-containing protein [Kordiimonas sp. SCSIO 12610]UTW53830.1 DUF4389 domain-containing protein [Kordiimonas sp. SCSIO 12610]
MSEETQKENSTTDQAGTEKKVTAKSTTKKAAPRKSAAKKTTQSSTAKKTTTRKKPAAKATSAKTATKKSTTTTKKTKTTAEKTAKPEEKVETMESTTTENSDFSKQTEETKSNAFNESETIKLNDLKEKDWSNILTRTFWMILLGSLASLAMWVCLTLALVQLVLTVIMDKPQEDVKDIMVKLGDFINRVVNYLSFKSDDNPLNI